MQIKTFTSIGAEEIPRTQGLYAFFLSNISPGKLGLRGGGPHTKEDLENARNNLLKRVSESVNLFQGATFRGGFVENKKLSHMQRRFVVDVEEEANVDFIEYIKGIKHEDLFSYINVASLMPFFTPPIYVGITKNQTLYERYFQHKSDFESNLEKSSFGTRLKGSNVRWSDIVFTCIEFGVTEDNSFLLNILEKHLQSITRPVLSVR